MASNPIGPEFLTKEKEGRLTVLKCRTPGEAFLVAEQLEAAGILAVLPDEADLLKQLEANGSVDIRVSSQSYEAARELQRIIETQHWEERAQQPLSVPMTLVAIALGMAFVPGGFFLFMMHEANRAKGFRRKAKSLRNWFVVGLVLLVLLVSFLPSLIR